jgi:hypothetical protein
MESTVGRADPNFPAATDRAESEELEWVLHPVLHQHRKTALLAAVVALAALAIYFNTRSVTWGAVGALILLLGVHDYLLPTRFRLTVEGVEVRFFFFSRRRTWAQLKSFYADHNGVLLSPFARPSRLDTFRGIYVRFADNRERIMAYVKSRMEVAA